MIERRGRAVAALVSLDDLEVIERERPTSAKPKGALAQVCSALAGKPTDEG